MKSVQATDRVYPTATNINALQMVHRTLGAGVQVRFIQTGAELHWCEIRLPRQAFEFSTVCCPGENQMAAAVNAVKQAERLRKAAA